jgi:flagellar motility protein MotE (MotC chaperone)
MSRKTAKNNQLPKKTKKTRRRIPARGVLWLIALLLMASGVVRIGGGTGAALAREVLAGAETPGVDTHGGEDTLTEASCAPPPDIAAILAQIQTREARVKAREAAMAEREQALHVAETTIAENLKALVAAETDLKATLALADSAAENDLARLTAVYENMKPKEASPLFAAMDPQFAAGFLARMRPDAAAAIMAGLEPEAAYTISVVLAGRNANVPTN